MSRETKIAQASRSSHLPHSCLVSINASADGSQLREDTFNKINYIVVPIVSAVGDQVWWPINSPTPVLILASVLATHAATRNFRPVVMGHPKVSGDYVSANSPQILQDYSFGFMFNSVFDDNSIKVEAWLDPIRAKEVGAAAENVITRLRAGKNVEVSEGNFCLAVYENGVFNGKKYGARWVSAVSDHLAMLDVDEIGACNNEMGCGRLDLNGARVESGQERNNNVILLSNNATATDTNTVMPQTLRNKGASIMKDNIFARMVSKIRAAMSNNDLRWKLYQALSELEPGVQYVDDEDVAAGTVRYVVMITFGDALWSYDNLETQYHWYQRTFSTDAQNNVTVNNDRIELIYDETKAWVVKPPDSTAADADEALVEPMAAEAKPACKCQGENANSKNDKEGESTMSAVKPTAAQTALASQLITSTAAPFEESDRGALEAMSEDKLKALAAKFEEAKTVNVTTVASVTTPAVNATAASIDPNTVVITRDEYASIKAAADAHASQIAVRKAHLVTSLKTAQNGFSEIDLTAMDLQSLEKLAVAFKIDTPAVADYSLRGVPESAMGVSAADKIKQHAPTDTWAAARAKREKIKQQTEAN